MQYFKYGQKELSHLKKADLKMAGLINEVGMIYREVNPDLYSALLHAIVGQQISSSAQKTVWERFKGLVNPLTPEIFLKFKAEEIQACGLSWRKVAYMSNLTNQIINQELDLMSLDKLSDQEVINELTKIKGIGVWTAEMLLIFSLQRPDIISYYDLAIIRGLKKLYKKDEITYDDFLNYKSRYSPYSSVASLYLWHYAVNQIDLK